MAMKAFYAFLVLLIGFLAYSAITLSAAKRALVEHKAEFVIGPVDADLTVVEYLDYACIYCQRMHPVIMDAIKRDGKVLYAPRPLLSSSKDGSTAAYIFYAAAMAGHAEKAHNYLMEHGVDLTEERMPQVASEIGLEFPVLDQNLKSGIPHNNIQTNMKTLNALKGRGTPTFFIGPDMMYLPEEMPTAEDFLKLFAQAREKHSALPVLKPE